MKKAELYSVENSGKVKCTACARYCTLGDGQIGLCGIRQNLGGSLYLLSYGKLFTGHIDPIEKKPVSHYNPGSRIFSVATSGCSWLCHAAGTKILMADMSTKSVEEISVNDVVWSYDIENGMKIVPNVVTHTGTRFAEIIEVKFGSNPENILLLTEEHPVLTQDGWKEARHLTFEDSVVKVSPGIAKNVTDRLQTLENECNVPRIESSYLVNHPKQVQILLSQKNLDIPVMANSRMLLPVKRIRRTGRIEQVYGLETIPNHNYVAGGVIAHNCKYCQNYDISQRRKIEGFDIEPQEVPRLALAQECQGIAYTYNEPTIFCEFARDIGLAAHKKGLFNIFVSNGFATPSSVSMMEQFLDCITVDFKGSGETSFVRKYIGVPSAEPIFQTLSDIGRGKKIHTEITDLIVPQVGDSLEAAKKLATWVYDHLGPEIPIHFLRFHPDYKMMEFPSTPIKTLEAHHKIAKEAGLKYVYLGNVPGHPLEHTYCPECGKVVVNRYGFEITGWHLDEKNNNCMYCGAHIAIEGSLSSTVDEDRFLPAYF